MNDLASEYQQYQDTTVNNREEAFEDGDEEEIECACGGGGLRYYSAHLLFS